MDLPETNLENCNSAPAPDNAGAAAVSTPPPTDAQAHESSFATSVDGAATAVAPAESASPSASFDPRSALAEAEKLTATLQLPAQVPAASVGPKPRKSSSSMMSSLQSLAVTVVIAMFVITFIVQAFQIPSESMEDTLLIGDYLLVDKVHFAHGGIWGEILPYHQIRHGDIIVFRYPVHPQQHFVKRVIGMPGDHIRMKDKQLFVNGRPVRERYVVYRSMLRDPYRDDFPRTDFLNANVEARWWLQMRSLVHNGELVVPPDQYFVLGDNRDESLDSRYWGFVPRENIIGRPLLIYWSMRHPERIGPVADTTGDKLLYFAYSVTHLFQQARWDRAFRLIK